MEDPWGSDAWSSADVKVEGNPQKSLSFSKWNTFERDADDNTIDVGIPSWSAASGSGWGEGTNLWHAESSTLDAWKPDLSIEEQTPESDLQPERDVTKEQEEEEHGSPEPRIILPTPPLSPLPIHPATPPSSPPKPSIEPPSPDRDPFGSFESAEILSEESHDAASWTLKTSYFPSEATSEPWGGGWGGAEKEDQEKDEQSKDEWEVAQDARRKRDRKLPPELLDSLVRQWDDFTATYYPKLSSEQGESLSWRKGLDSVDGLSELVDSLIPVTAFPPPMPFNKTAVAKSVKETLHLTRFFAVTQSSPMAHLHASKGSTDWEKSVKAQNGAANDEWGWDLKHEPEEKSEPTDSTKDKKGGGLLSFWSRKASSIPSTPTGDLPTPNPPKSPTVISKATSPSTSARPSIDSSRVASPTTTTLPSSSPSTVDMDAVSSDPPVAQPSAVSRFLNRFSRKPSAVTTPPPGKEGPSSLSLSPDDFSFLSDMAPSTSEIPLQSQQESTSASSLEAMLSLSTASFSPGPSKLPAPLARPPSRASGLIGHRFSDSHGSDTSFDAKMADTQIKDLLDTVMGAPSSQSPGYSPIIVDIGSSVESGAPSSAFQGPESPTYRIMHQSSSFSQSSRVQGRPPVNSQIRETRSAMSSPILPQPVSAPTTSSLHNAQHSPTMTAITTSVPAPPIPPPHTPDRASRQQPITLARFHNPLPPTPKPGVDDVIDFLSTSPPSGAPPDTYSPQSAFSSGWSGTASLLSSVSNQSPLASSNVDDFGDFGDFISTPLRTPSPPKVPKKTFKITDHQPTLELVEKAASRQGRWPASPSPLPQPLPPPPGSSSNSYLNKAPGQPLEIDLLTSDNSLSKGSSMANMLSMTSQPSSLPQPLFVSSPSHPTSTLLDVSPMPIAGTLTSRTSTPSLLPGSEPSKPVGASGLSAQDLSFFEGL